MKHILIISSEDVCRSRMAKALLADFGRGMHLTTAGVIAGNVIPQLTDEVMGEHGYELSHQKAKALSDIQVECIDFVITLCPDAKEAFLDMGLDIKSQAHFDISDPFAQRGSEDQLRTAVETTYEELYRSLFRLYRNVLSDMLMPTCTCGANTYCRCE